MGVQYLRPTESNIDRVIVIFRNVERWAEIRHYRVQSMFLFLHVMLLLDHPNYFHLPNGLSCKIIQKIYIFARGISMDNTLKEIVMVNGN